MFILEKTFTFEAAHQLLGHDGKCARLHGHSWRGTIICHGDTLHTSGAKKGMLIDYGDMKAAVSPLIENYLDHHFLNNTIPGDFDPTSEVIAQWLFYRLLPELPNLYAVIIEETCTSKCTFIGEGLTV